MNTGKRITWKTGPIWRSDIIFRFRCYYTVILSLHFVTFIMFWLVRHEFNKESIPFLDLKVSLSGGYLTTDLDIKSTVKHQYLHYTSAHPDHTKSSIVLSQTLSVSRTCYIKTDFERHLDDMKSWSQASSYHKDLAQNEMNKGRFNPIQDGLFWGCSRMGESQKGPPSLKSVTHILQWWNLAQIYLPKEDRKNIWITWHTPWVLLT